MTRLHTDLSRVPISVAPSPATSGTSLGVTDANAAYLPDTYPYWAVCVPTNAAPTRANSEIVKVTGGSSSGGTTTLTIVRAQGIPATTAQTVTTSFDIYDANSSQANIGLNGLIMNETPSGTVNGSNTAFDTASAYVAGSIQVYRDGQLMKGGGADYTETDSNTITFTTAPATGSVLLVTYQTTVTTSGNADTLDGYHANATPTASNIPVLDSGARLPYADGWTPAGETWTYASASTITVPSGAASRYAKGDKIKLTQTTVKYFYVIAVADTTLTVTGGSDYTVADAAISANYYSHASSPIGFPSYFNYTPNLTTGSADLSGYDYARFSIEGNLMRLHFAAYNRSVTGSAGQIVVTMPLTTTSSTGGYSIGDCIIFNGSSYLKVRVNEGAGTFAIFKGITSETWAANETGIFIIFNASVWL